MAKGYDQIFLQKLTGFLDLMGHHRVTELKLKIFIMIG